MVARVTMTQTAGPVPVEEAHRGVLAYTLPWLREQPGFRGLVVLASDKSGKSIAATLWEDEESMRATEEQVEEIRDNVSRAVGAVRREVEEYTVLFFGTA